MTALVTAGITALLVNIFERKQEARNPFYRVVEIDDNTVDPAIWGKNFPLQYDAYKRTVDQDRTRYGGSRGASPSADTRGSARAPLRRASWKTTPASSRCGRVTRFSTDFREERGHAYMLDDQRYTRRVTEFKQPGTCLNCHASTYVSDEAAGQRRHLQRLREDQPHDLRRGDEAGEASGRLHRLP